jgi:membrane-bound lysozyme inhibitor of c-type lysozyme MliC
MTCGAGALAAPADYQCDGGVALTADFSPRKAQVRFDGQQWTLLRVREAREARYVAARDGVAITLLRNQANLERKGQPTLACKLLVRALRPETLGITPPPGAASAVAR